MNVLTDDKSGAFNEGEYAGTELRDYLDALKRRLALFSITILGIILAAIVTVFLMPAVYRSAGTILIEQQEIPNELVRSTITSYADQRIQMISQRVMTTANLTEIMNDYGLYETDRKLNPDEVVIEQLRDDIDLKMISAEVVDPRSGRPTKASIAFQISYENESPRLAQRVANELTSLFLNENIRSRSEMASETTSFLKESAERLAKDVTDHEKALADFKDKNADSLPEIYDLNVQIRERLLGELRQLENDLRSTQERIIYLQAQKAAISPRDAVYSASGQRLLGAADRLKILESELVAERGRYSSDHPSISQLERSIKALREEVEEPGLAGELMGDLEQQKALIAELQDRYSKDHPDVLAAIRKAEAISNRISSLSTADEARKSEPPDNPVYIQLASQIQAAEIQRASLTETIAGTRQRLESIEASLKASPQVEQQYRELARGYENALAKFQDVKAKQLEAELSESLEKEQKGERFILIEPPLLPEEPVKPNRVLLLLGAIFLALSAGVISVVIAETLDSSVHSPRELMRITGAAPLATIPVIETNRDTSLNRRNRLAIFLIGGLIAFAILMSIHTLVRPLDVLAFSIMRRLGL